MNTFGPGFNPNTPRPVGLSPLDPVNNGVLGPSQSVLEAYRELTQALEQGVKPGFNPRVAAENMGRRLDDGAIVYHYNPATDGPNMDYQSYWHLGQQAFAASVLGLRIHPLHVTASDWTASAKRGLGLTVPPADSLPVLRGGALIDPSTNQPVSRGRADTTWAQHFLISNRRAFTKPRPQPTSGSRDAQTYPPAGPFEKAYVRVIDQAENGELAVNTRPNTDMRGPVSFMRTVAKSLGYVSVGQFKPDRRGIWRAPVDPTARRAGFDSDYGAYTPETRRQILNQGK